MTAAQLSAQKFWLVGLCDVDRGEETEGRVWLRMSAPGLFTTRTGGGLRCSSCLQAAVTIAGGTSVTPSEKESARVEASRLWLAYPSRELASNTTGGQ